MLWASIVALPGPVPAGFPSAVIPFQSLEETVALLPGCLVIAIVSYVGSISLAMVFAKVTQHCCSARVSCLTLGPANVP